MKKVILLTAVLFSVMVSAQVKKVETKAEYQRIDLNTEIKTLNRETALYLEFAEKVGLLSDDFFEVRDLKIYPNPNNGKFTIEFTETPSAIVKVFVYDLLGNVIFSDESDGTGELYSKEIDLTDQPAGVYFLLIRQNDKSQTKKIEKL